MKLTEMERAKLSDTRRMCEALRDRASEEALTGNDDVSVACNLGRFAEAADAAETAVFNVLNVAAAFLDDKDADKAIRDYRD